MAHLDTRCGRDLAAWPDTTHEPAPRDHLYRSATWLLGRHLRLAHLAARVRGVVEIEEGQNFLDLDHLAEVIAAVPGYAAAWEDYERRRRPPTDQVAYERWRDAGPRAEDTVPGLGDVLVMSSGETAALRLLACFATVRVPFRVADLASLDSDGQRLLADWTTAVHAA
jgi:hypothetical protein